ncbi:cell wall hydrolase [Sphingomonas gilva]|uniref:Cell wall hydrolase n=1 Tax=Sphingomonas gilva TaxID=2305907 RepID=A0A396RUL4_9SPHN|nr:cell wall hydrolase [Sphingomonas gilva]RHW18123.1 cell wall hydrolase [Sphingomonas gilva]
MLARALRDSPLLAGAFALVALSGIGMSAKAALTAFAYGTGDARAITLPATGLEGDDRFPGAALAYAETPDLPRAAAATGYYDIPASLAATAPADFTTPADLGVLPAPSMAFRGRSGVDSMRAAQCLATAIYYEAASESEDGQRAVAQVVLNRVRHPAFPNSVCGVVFQGHERATGCQFSFTCDGAMARAPSVTGYARALRIAHEALAGRVYAPVGNATHYHTFRVWPVWGKSLVMTAAVGAHFFHRWKGYWGTPQAFRAGYAGVEPAVPAWTTRAPQPATLPTPALAQAATAVPPPIRPPDATRIQPEHAQSGDPIVTADAESQILDKWKDSGKPLR